ncbi:MAG: glycosyltransferase family 4 protein [Flavobacteriales bacterium]|nr:MAG: glycosyltransferase family 4 protein [Flavobacteriales bacterium]
MPRPLTIAYVTTDDANDKRSWSGIHYHLAEELRKQGHRLVLIGPLQPQPLLFVLRAFNQITLRLFGKRFHYRDSPILSRAYAGIIAKRLRAANADVVLAPAGLAAIAKLKTDVPIIHFNDRSIAGAVGYHSILKDPFAWSLRQSLELEREALRNAALTVFTSDWAADGARKSEPSSASRIRVIPMGANLGQVPAPEQRVFPPEVLKLLMIGVQWENKGGPLALEVLRELARRGINAQLIVCGCDVPKEVTDKNVVREGFLSKSDPRQRARLEEHLRAADLFILPTRFEAYGIAFCEAAAYGVPALGSRTGGVPTIVLEGETGFLFNLDEGARAYADRIEQLVRDPATWQRMRTTARKRYEEHFTWEAFVQRLMAEVEAAGLVRSSR